jgi:hypothetical protein
LKILDKPEGEYHFQGIFHDSGKRTGKLIFPDLSEITGDFYNDFDTCNGIITQIPERYGILSMQGNFEGFIGLDSSIKYLNGSYYRGATVGFKKHGKGLLLNENGKYKGYFVNDRLYHGKHLDKDMNIYEGYFKSHKGQILYDGYGFIYEKNGRCYHGTFRKGLKHGDGIIHEASRAFTCHYVDGKRYSCSYIGEFIN